MQDRTRTWLRLHHAVMLTLVVAAIALLAMLSERYWVSADWTHAGRNSLSEPSRRLLERVEGPLVLTSFSSPGGLARKATLELVERYRRVKADIDLELVDPAREPGRVRELDVRSDGELRLSHDGRTVRVEGLTEDALSNAVLRVARTGDRWLAYLTGHGERDLLGSAPTDLGTFSAALRARGYSIRPLNLTDAASVPDNAGVLVLTRPRSNLSTAEVRAVLDFLARGGNLLWLGDPGDLHGLAPLSEQLGVGFVPGAIIDPASDSPIVVRAADYRAHAITEGLAQNVALVLTGGLAVHASAWRATPLILTHPRAWSETGKLEGSVRYDAGVDHDGPLVVAVALERAATTGAAPQRVVVVGDADFLSDTYLAEGGNLELGQRAVDWLFGDTHLLDIPARAAADLAFEPGTTGRVLIALGPPVVLPLALVAIGVVIWRRRRHR